MSLRMNRKTLLLSALFLLALFYVTGTGRVEAEGSKELIANGGDRPSLEWDTVNKLKGIERTTTLYVYAKQGETIRLGSSVYTSYASGNDISLTPPGGSAQSLDVVKNGAGHIATLDMEQKGPEFVIGGTTYNAGGYKPISTLVGAGQAGWWKIEFHGPSTSGNPAKKATTAALADNGSGGDVEAWDVTVTKGDGTSVPGRLFTYSLAMNMGNSGASLKSIVYVLTKDGFTYKTNMNGIDPFGYLFFSNSRGYIDNTSGGTLYHSVPFDASDVTVQNPNGPDSLKSVTHRVFFNPPSADLPADVPTLPIAPPTPQDFTFTNAAGAGPVTGVGQGGTFSFGLTSPATYQIILDTDGIAGYNVLTDTVLENNALTGSTNLVWNGKKKDGTNLAKGTYKAKITSKGGEYHFPMLDVENAPNGIIIESLYAPDGYSFDAGSQKMVYYDDSNYLTAGGQQVCMSGTSGSSCATSPVGATNPLTALDGVSSATGAHKFSSNYGNDKAIDTWTYFPGTSKELTFTVVQGAVSGKVFHDANRNGTQDSGEAVLAGIKVKITDPGTEETYVVTTGADGAYTLPVSNGSVKVEVDSTSLPPGKTVGSTTANVTVNNDVKTANFGAVDNRAPVASDDSKTTNKGVALSGSMSAADADAEDILTYTIVTLPANGTLTANADGSYTYTPNASFTGTDNFTFTANDGKADSNIATVTIKVNAPPTAIEVDVLGSKRVGETLTGSYTYVDIDEDLPDTPIYKWYRGTNADGSNKVLIDGATAATYVPTSGDLYQLLFFEVTPIAKTGALTGSPVLSAAHGPILAANAAPIASNDTKKTNMNKALAGTLSASDPNTEDTLTFSKVSDPEHGTLTVDEDGTYEYTPNKGYTGTDSFTFKANDGKADSNVATVTIQVNAPPTATDVEIGGVKTVGKTLTGSYTYGDVDADVKDVPIYKWYRGTKADGSDKEVIDGATAATYAATLGDLGKLIFFEVTPKAKTGVPTGSPILSAGYGPIVTANVAPVAHDGAKSTYPNTAVSGTLSATDVDTNDELIYSLNTDAVHGTVTVSADGSYTYTPDDGYVGTDTFTFKASDGKADSNIATVTITVTNRTPTAIAQDVVISVNGAVYGGQLHGNDPDPGDTLTFAKASDPAHGTVTVNADGMYTYKPTPGYGGEDSFTFTTTDNHGATSAPAKVTIAVAEPGTYVIRLVADPDTLIGDGNSTSLLTSTLLDSDGRPVPGVTIKFGATSGTFPNGDEAVTNAAGQATILYKTSKISRTTAQVIPVTADVHDIEKGIYSHQQIDVTFQPAAIRGVVASTAEGKRVVEAGVMVRISNAAIGFSAETKTDEMGQYAIPVPEGDLIYSIEIIKLVTVGGETKQVSFKQTATVGDVSGGGEEYFDSDKVATGIIVLAKPDGSQKLLNDQNSADRDMAAQIKIKIQDPDTGAFIKVNGQDAFALDSSGVFSIPGLVKGKKYGLAIVYSLPDAQGGGAAKEIIMNAVDNDGKLPKFELSADGELNILDELIDPYGDITDKVAGTAVEGAHVVLYYADTARNRAAGITPGTQVVLPAIAGFAPNDNANPQTSKDGGKYAYMVYPQTDYYLVVTATGYETYVSPTIPVEYAIIRHDVPLTPQSATPAPAGSSAPSEPVPKGAPDLIVNVSIDRSVYEEISTATVTVKYKNNGDAVAKGAQVTLAIPEGAQVLDAAGGTVSDGKIVWKPGMVEMAASGQFIVKLKWPQIDMAERMAELNAKASAANLAADGAANAEASVKLLIFSNRYGNVSHTRYILGYPDKTFLPNRTLTRAELAAIIARLIDGGSTTLKAQYSDIRVGHWASGYIRIASDNGIFTGYTDGSFHPDSPVTREELAAVMVRYLKLKVAQPLDPKFADAEGRWSSAAIEALFRNALTTGYEDGTFKPSAPIVRQEAVTMINRLLYRGPLGGVEASFPDAPVSSWSFGQIEEATRSHESTRAADGSEIYVKTIEDNVH